MNMFERRLLGLSESCRRRPGAVTVQQIGLWLWKGGTGRTGRDKMTSYTALMTGLQLRGQRRGGKEALEAKSDRHFGAAVRAQIVELVHHGCQNRQRGWSRHSPREDLFGEEGHSRGQGVGRELKIDAVWL